MSRVCQGSYGVFALSIAVSLGATVVAAVPPTPHVAPVGIPTHLTAWAARPFPGVALEAPELASCFLLSPGWWNSAGPPQALPDEGALSKALAAQLAGLVDLAAVPRLEVVIAVTESTRISAVAHGDAVLALLPKAEPATTSDVARALAQALLAAGARPAPPDPRCGEPLEMIGEAIAMAGSLTLAALPPELRPVRDWLELKDAEPPLEVVANETFDTELRWSTRRAKLARMGFADGSNPQLASAAALVVEAYGDAPRARRHPFDLLLAWLKGSGKQYPGMPRALRNALEKPLEAGMPRPKDATDRAEVERDALARRIATGDVALAEIPSSTSLPWRLLAAAQLRARGGPKLCEWLTAAPLPPMRTGCRAEGEEGGVVFARPTVGGSQVVWRSPAGEEGVLLVWPRWVLFPLVVPPTGEVWFIDSTGVWSVPLDAHLPPRLAATGSFRHLAASPDGKLVATARWPSGQVLLVGASSTRELSVNGRGGIAWLEADVVAASDGENLSLASTQGQVQPNLASVPCCCSLVASRGALIGAVSAPCDSALVRIMLAEKTTRSILKLGEGPLGLVALPGGVWVFGGPDGVWQWRGEGAPERSTDGLTPGPG
jgi:hypothetical protein